MSRNKYANKLRHTPDNPNIISLNAPNTQNTGITKRQTPVKEVVSKSEKCDGCCNRTILGIGDTHTHTQQLSIVRPSRRSAAGRSTRDRNQATGESVLQPLETHGVGIEYMASQLGYSHVRISQFKKQAVKAKVLRTRHRYAPQAEITRSDVVAFRNFNPSEGKALVIAPNGNVVRQLVDSWTFPKRATPEYTLFHAKKTLK